MDIPGGTAGACTNPGGPLDPAFGIIGALFGVEPQAVWVAGRDITYCNDGFAPSSTLPTGCAPAFTSPSPGSGEFNSVWGSAAKDAWAVGSAGMIVHCTPPTDGGNMRPAIDCASVVAPNAQLPSLASVRTGRAGDAWIAGDQGTLLHCTGTDASQCAPPELDCVIPASTNFSALWVSDDAKDLWAVGADGTMVNVHYGP
jgi:hypothetical protein